MITTSLTSYLDALNMMLTAADEAPVLTAELGGHLPLAIAIAVLNDVSRVIQSLGWAFNTEHDFPLSRGTDGRIALPTDTLSVDSNEYSDCAPVARGLIMYDRQNHTEVFTHDLKVTLIRLLSWDSLPQAARHYISVRAARSYQVRMQAGDAVFKMTEADERAALLALESLEADTGDANFLTDSYSVGSVLLYRE